MEVQDWVRLGVVALAGLPAGWFVAVLVDRIPDKRPLFRPFPAVPVVEGVSGRLAVGLGLLTVVAFGLFADRFASNLLLVPYLVLVVAGLALSVIDLRTLRLPDRLVFPLIGTGAVLLTLAELGLDRPQRLTYAAVGAAFYFGFLFLANLVYPAGMGFGDVKMSLALGMYVGFLGADVSQALALVLYAMLLGFVLGSVAGVAVLVARGRSASYPFGPFLVVGTLVVVLLSDRLADGL